MSLVRIKYVFVPVLVFLFFLLLLSSLPSCTHDPANLDALDTVCFDTQVMPYLQASCGTTGCHDGSTEGFSAADYQSVLQYVVPGDPRASKLYKVITDIQGENLMPPGSPLTKEVRTLIHVWIAQGAINKKCSTEGGGNGGGGGNKDSICFAQVILPMLVSSCGTTGCHDALTGAEGYVMADYNTIISRGIAPYYPNSSKILQVVGQSGEDRMPPYPRSPLTTDQIAALRKWISDGALNSNCPGTTCDTTGAIAFTTHVDPILQSNCVGCHNSSSASGNINLTSYNNVKTYAQTLRNGQPLLTGVIRQLPGFTAMPPGFSLDQCTIRTMELWISGGLVNK